MNRGNFLHLAHRCLNKPAMILPQKYQIILGVLAPRMGVAALEMPGGETFAAGDLARLAAADRAAPPRAGGRDRVFARTGNVAVIPIEGTLVNKLHALDPYSGMTGYDGIRVKLHEAANDPDIAGILLDIDSPGGEVPGCFDLVDEIFALRGKKPVWALASEDAFSAAYAIASAAERVFVPRTGGMGSIGVICGHADMSGALEREGVKVTMIYAGARKNDGSPCAPLADEAYAAIKAEIDRAYDIFCATVARNRGIDVAAVRATEAACFFGPNAVAAGLADEVAPPAEVLARMLSGLAAGRNRPGVARARPNRKGNDMSNAKNKGISGVLAAIGTLVSAAGAAEKDDEEARKAAPPESDDPEKENPEEEKRDDEEADDAEKAEEEGAAEKSARAAEKARIRDILGAPAAKGREATAQALALDTEISAAEVVAVLERIPRAACVPRALASAMETHKPPVIGTGPSGDDDHAAATIAQRIAGYVNVRRAR